MIDRFKRAIRYRKWAILLIPLIGPLGELTESAINNNSVNTTTMMIHYVGIAVIVIAFSMVKDEYKNQKD
jgi:hypothetical protein